jgi:hypothetical protein
MSGVNTLSVVLCLACAPVPPSLASGGLEFRDGD